MRQSLTTKGHGININTKVNIELVNTNGIYKKLGPWKKYFLLLLLASAVGLLGNKKEVCVVVFLGVTERSWLRNVGLGFRQLRRNEAIACYDSDLGPFFKEN